MLLQKTEEEMTLLNSFCTGKIQIRSIIQIRVMWENYRPTLPNNVDTKTLSKTPINRPEYIES